MAKISELIPDSQNANKHTQKGSKLLNKSLRELGFGRSILVDKNNKIIAGNSTAENCADIGIEDVQFIDTDGTKIIAVRRTDVDIDSKIGRELAIADNQTAKAGIEFDMDVIQDLSEEYGIDLSGEWEIENYSMPSELNGVDMEPDNLANIKGDDESIFGRVIITFPFERQAEIESLLGVQLKKVLFSINELLGDG